MPPTLTTTLTDRDTAVSRIRARTATLPLAGDGFLPAQQLDATHVTVGGEAGGTALVCHGDTHLTLVDVDPALARWRRQVLRRVLRDGAPTQAFAASWDSTQIELFGGFATSIATQAYQFQLCSTADLTPAVTGLTLAAASTQDLPYLESTGFQPDFPHLVGQGRVRIARLRGRPVGVGLAFPHPSVPHHTDIGMFVDPAARGEGVGRSLVALLADEVAASGDTAVAGCWWRNWASRATLESAGLTCVGTIFAFTLDADMYGRDLP